VAWCEQVAGLVKGRFWAALLVLVLVAVGCLWAEGQQAERAPETPADVAIRAQMLQWDWVTSSGEQVAGRRVNDPQLLANLFRYWKSACASDPPGQGDWTTYILELQLASGERARYRYLVPDLSPCEPGYVEFPAGWYRVPAEFNIVFEALGAYDAVVADVDERDAEFLRQFGWTAAFRINTLGVTLPSQFRHAPGEYPVVLYWAYNNELNRDVGLDLTPVLGQTVEARLYKVAEPLPEFMHPRRETGRAVIVRHEGRIVGAWLDAGRHWGFACSLSGRRFEEVTGKTWDEWIPALIDPQDPLERELSRLSPEDLIRTYYAAVDRGDYTRAHACQSRRWLATSLFANMDNRFLYNPGFRDYDVAGLANITSARVIAIRRQERFEENFRRDYPPGTRIYEVRVDLQVREPVTFESGPQTRFVTLRRETPATGWRIESIGTGP